MKPTPIELEMPMGKDINGVEHREPWKAYDIDEVDSILAKKDAEIARLIEDWNRLCEKYNKFIKLKQEFCDKFNDLELEITK